MFGTSEVSARSDPIGGITLRAQMSWWDSEVRLWKFRTFCDWDVLCCRSTWLTAQTETDSKRQAWWAGSYISVTHLDHCVDFGFKRSNLRVFPSLTPECVCTSRSWLSCWRTNCLPACHYWSLPTNRTWRRRLLRLSWQKFSIWTPSGIVCGRSRPAPLSLQRGCRYKPHSSLTRPELESSELT